MNGQVYESSEQGNGNKSIETSAMASVLGQTCKVPPSQFRVRFEPVNRFESGIQMGVNVDGILCLSREDARKVFETRLTEIMDQWDGYIKKA